MNILVTDTETTGLPSADGKAVMIEVAGILYNVETQSELAMASTLVYSPDNAAEHINGIKPETLALMQPPDLQNAMGKAYQVLWDKADYALAHNAAFDRYFLDPIFGKKKPAIWRCSKNDLKFPKAKNARSLAYLAVDHGVWPFAAHRALNDCLTLVQLLKLIPNLSEQMACTPEESGRFEAVDLLFEQRHLAKDAGFKWDSARKVWWKNLKQSEAMGLPFRVQKVQ